MIPYKRALGDFFKEKLIFHRMKFLGKGGGTTDWLERTKTGQSTQGEIQRLIITSDQMQKCILRDKKKHLVHPTLNIPY